MTQQPKWKLIVNLGDANPIAYGGVFVYRDETGIYPPEMEKLESIENAFGEPTKWEVHRVVLDQCKIRPGSARLIPAKYDPATWTHPIASYDEWFNDSLSSVADFAGIPVDELREMFCSSDPVTLAFAYQAVFNYHGWDNGDSYPLTFTDEDELKERYQIA